MRETSETTETLEPVTSAVQTFAPSKATAPRAVIPTPAEPHLSRRHLADEHDEDEGFFERHRLKLIVMGVVMVGGAISYLAMTAEKAPVRKAPERNVVSIQLPPPPAPPPPPPPPPKVVPPPPKEEKMIEQKPVEDTPKPPEKPADEPPPAIGTSIRGNGPGDGLAVGGSGGGARIGGNGGGSGGGRFDMYAGQVQTTIANALRRNPKTRSASINRLAVRLWLDATGRVTDARLGSSTGDVAVDAALKGELVGSQLAPPPAGMPMPIVMRVTAQRR